MRGVDWSFSWFHHGKGGCICKHDTFPSSNACCRNVLVVLQRKVDRRSCDIIDRQGVHFGFCHVEGSELSCLLKLVQNGLCKARILTKYCLRWLYNGSDDVM